MYTAKHAYVVHSLRTYFGTLIITLNFPRFLFAFKLRVLSVMFFFLCAYPFKFHLSGIVFGVLDCKIKDKGAGSEGANATFYFFAFWLTME